MDLMGIFWSYSRSYRPLVDYVFSVTSDKILLDLCCTLLVCELFCILVFEINMGPTLCSMTYAVVYCIYHIA